MQSKMAVQWQRSNSYESALADDCALATEKLCPSVCRVAKSGPNAVRISPEQDVWKACTRELLLEFFDLTYEVKVTRNGKRPLLLCLKFPLENHELLFFCSEFVLDEYKCYWKLIVITNRFDLLREFSAS